MADEKYPKVHNKIAGEGKPPTLEEHYILNTRNNAIPTPHQNFSYLNSG